MNKAKDILIKTFEKLIRDWEATIPFKDEPTKVCLQKSIDHIKEALKQLQENDQ